MPPAVVDGLKALGHPIKTTAIIAAAQMAGVSAGGKTLTAAADPRVPGEARGFDKAPRIDDPQPSGP